MRLINGATFMDKETKRVLNLLKEELKQTSKKEA